MGQGRGRNPSCSRRWKPISITVLLALFCLLVPGKPSDSVCLLSLGRTVIGSLAKDIALQGPGLAPEHCYIENLRGTLTLYPCGNACAIDGLPVRQPTRLTQGE